MKFLTVEMDNFIKERVLYEVKVISCPLPMLMIKQNKL